MKDMKIGQKLMLGFLAVAAIVLVAGLIGLNTSNTIMEKSDLILDEKVPIKDCAMELVIASGIQQTGLHAYMLGEQEGKSEYIEGKNQFLSQLADANNCHLSNEQMRLVSEVEDSFTKIDTYAQHIMEYSDLAKRSKDKSGNDMEVMDAAAGPLIDKASDLGLSVYELNLINEQVMTVNDYLITGSDDEIDAFEEVRQEIEGFADYGLIRNEHAKVINLAEVTIQSYKDYLNYDALAWENMELMDAEMSSFEEHLTRLEEMADSEMADAMEIADATHASGITFIIVSILTGILLAVGIGLAVTRMITKPVKELEAVSKQVADGDLRVNIGESLLSSKDEIGNLSNSFQTMVSNLQALIGNIKRNSTLTASSSEELSASAEEVNASMEQVASTIQEVAKGAQSVSKSSSEAQEMSKKTAESGQAGSKSAQTVNQIMGSISTTTRDGSQKIKALGKKSEEIGKIVDTIQNISEQTNLLALNAAIEAARAGEAGRGFAVVADEVRKLAEESSKASGQIADLILGIQKEISGAVETMDANSKQVDEGGKAVQEALKAFEVIPGLVQNISKSMMDMAAVAQENAAGSEQVSSSVEEVTSAMQQVSSSAQQLSSAAEELKQMVSRFKVADNGEMAQVEKHTLGNHHYALRKHEEQLKKLEKHHEQVMKTVQGISPMNEKKEEAKE